MTKYGVGQEKVKLEANWAVGNDIISEFGEIEKLPDVVSFGDVDFKKIILKEIIIET